MKRIISCIVVLMMLFTLMLPTSTVFVSASADPSIVIGLIDALKLPGSITLDDMTEIGEARAAYDELAPGKKGDVTNYSKLVAVEEEINKQIERKNAVYEMIYYLPDIVVYENKADIEAARAAYDALTEAQKVLVLNYTKLLGAEAAMERLESIHEVLTMIQNIPAVVSVSDRAAIEAARAAYDELNVSGKMSITNYTKLTDAEDALKVVKVAAVNAVIGMIDSIPEDVLNNKEKVVEARTAYNVLDADLQAQVTNLVKLTNAEAIILAFESIKADEDSVMAGKVIAKIEQLPVIVGLTDKAEIEDARAEYDALSSAQKLLVSNYSKLTKAEVDLLLLQGEADSVIAGKVVDKIKQIPSIVTLGDRVVIEEARTEFNTLNSAQKAHVTNYNDLLDAEDAIAVIKQAAVDAVIAKIDKIPEDVIAGKDIVQEARAAYDLLDADLKVYVTNVYKLNNAEAIISAYDSIFMDETNIVVGKVIIKIDQIPAVIAIGNKAQIEEARADYDVLSFFQKPFVTNYTKLVKSEEDLEKILTSSSNFERIPDNKVPLTNYRKVGAINNLKVVSKKSKQIKVSYKKVSGIKGYEIKISTKKNFVKKNTSTFTTKKTSCFIKKHKGSSLKSGKNYYVLVRAYRKSVGIKIYGKNKAQKIKVK